jgi:hypothetical protein
MSDIKPTVAVLCLLGFSTCLLPLFSVSPPALGKTEWSAWDIFRLLTSGPNPVGWLLRPEIFRLWVAYALLAAGPLLLWLPQYYKPLAICAVTSLWLIGRMHLHYEFSRMFEVKQTGWHTGTFIIEPSAFVLPALLVFLLFVLSIEFKNHSSTA